MTSTSRSTTYVSTAPFTTGLDQDEQDQPTAALDIVMTSLGVLAILVACFGIWLQHRRNSSRGVHASSGTFTTYRTPLQSVESTSGVRDEESAVLPGLRLDGMVDDIVVPLGTVHIRDRVCAAPEHLSETS